MNLISISISATLSFQFRDIIGVTVYTISLIQFAEVHLKNFLIVDSSGVVRSLGNAFSSLLSKAFIHATLVAYFPHLASEIWLPQHGSEPL